MIDKCSAILVTPTLSGKHTFSVLNVTNTHYLLRLYSDHACSAVDKSELMRRAYTQNE